MVAVVSIFIGVAVATAPLPAGAGCVDVLDAVTEGQERCGSPDEANVEAVVKSDAKPAPEAPLRDPAMFSSQLGFVAGLIGLGGGGVIVAAVAQDGRARDLTGAYVQQGTWVAGVSLLALSGGVFAGAVATWVFDPSTGELRLPIFDGEPR